MAKSVPYPHIPEESTADSGILPARDNLRRLLEELQGKLECDRLSVTLTEDSAYGLHLRVLATVGTELPTSDATDAGEPDAYFQPGVRAKREQAVCQDIATQPHGIPLEKTLLSLGLRSYAKLPLVSGDRLVGGLNIASQRTGYFTQARLELAQEACGPLAGIAWHVALLRWHEQQSQILSLSQRLTETLSTHLGVRKISEQFAEQLAVQLDADRVSVYLVNDDRTWLTHEALYARDAGVGEIAQLTPGISLEEPSIVTEALTNRPVTLVNPDRILTLPESVSAQLGLDRFPSLVVIPLMHGEIPVGVVFGQRKNARPIVAPDAVGSLALLGQQIGLMLHTRRLMEHQERTSHNFTELLNMSHAVSSTADLTQLPELVARQARDLCDADESTLCLLEPDGVTLRPVVCLGEWAEQVLEARIRVGQGITGTVAARRRGELINRAELDPRSVQIPGTPLEPEAILAVPLVCADRLVGALALHKLDGAMFNPVDLDTLEIFASQAAVAFENARLIASIREERTRLVTMLQQMEEGVMLVDKEGMVLLINTAARRMLNLNGDDQVAKSALEFIQGSDFEVLRSALARVQSDEERNITEEYTMRGRAYLVSVSAVHDDDGGERSGEVLLFKDVTDLKEIEAQLLQSSKMSAVGQLAAGVAHEFNNLNASIYGYAQFMQEHQDPKVIKKGVDIILKSSERARELTSSLLTFSRRRPGRREPVDINQILTDTLLLLHRQLEKSRIRVVRDTGRVPLTVADPGKLQQVVLNVLINAQQAMVEGGELRVVSRSQNGSVEIVIEDEGVGIAADDLPRIFEPFFTTKGPLSGVKTPGVGLGLSSAYNILRDHGGSITAASREGKGTALTIRVPVRSLRDPEVDSAAPRPPRSLEVAGRILIVDENPALSGLIAEILEGMGHQVVRAEDAAQAKRSLAEGGCDLLILDHTSSDCGGAALYRETRETLPELPVVFVTSRSAGEEVEADGDPWMFRINKPFRNRDLISLVARVLAQKLRRAG